MRATGFTIGRREFLAGSLAAATGCGRRAGAPAPAAPVAVRERLAKVRVSPDRVIRTVAGLRPYRPSGFVVRREDVLGKTLIHNYGHGGGGITLSWGTADLAVRLAQPFEERAAAVLGCGAVGLATARLLQRRGLDVTIYARELPPETTSNIAGGQWWPTSVFDTGSASPEFEAQFVEAARLAYRHYQALPAERYGIRWLRNYLVGDNPIRDSFILGAESPLRELYPEYADLPENATPFGRYARRFTSMLIEPPIYLRAMVEDFRIAGGRIVVRELGEAAAVAALAENLVFNCTGLGAGKLFGDTEIKPVKGQLTFLLPQPEVDYNLMTGGLYMFPRRDGILLGGSWESGNWDTTPDPDVAARILSGHQAIFAKA